MKSLTTVAVLLLAAIASQPALAQEKKDAETVMVAGRPALPTDSLKALFAMRESWGTEPAMSTAKPEKG